MKEKKIKIALMCVLILFVLFILFLSFIKTNKFSETKMMMGTFVKIDICCGLFEKNKINKVYQEVWQRLEDISLRMSIAGQTSEITKINNSYDESVFLSDDTHKLLIDAYYFNKLTKGSFDVTVLPLINLWKDVEKINAVPSKKKIEEIMKHTGMHNFQIQAGNKIRRLNRESKIDLGAIAKGFAVDEAAKIIRSKNFKNFFIQAGGDDYVSGNNCKGQLWHVGVRDPKDSDKIVDILKLKNLAVTTSGSYERFYTINGKKYSHIIDPNTGYPQEGVISATVIAPHAKEADALSTSLCVMGPETGIKFIDSLSKNFAAMILYENKNGEIIRVESKQYKKFKY